MITQEQLKHHLHYEPATGQFTWLRPTTNKNKAGARAGTISNGYIGITILGHRTYAHRLAFLYMEGDYPHAQIIDHIDRNKLNNCWANLRRYSTALNMLNKDRRVDNKSGTTGVFFNPACGKRPWIAYINHAGVREYLGHFSTYKEAVETRAKKELHLVNADQLC